MVGENLDGPFSGASLCGAISGLCDFGFRLYSDLKAQNVSNSTILVRDDGDGAFNIDIRRIDQAASSAISESSIMGSVSLEKNQKSAAETVKDQSPREISSMLSRKLRRLTLA